MKAFRNLTWSVLACVLLVVQGNAQESFPVLQWSTEYNVRDAKFNTLLNAGANGFYTYRAAQNSLLTRSRDEYFAYYSRKDLREEWLIKTPRWEFEGRRVDFMQSNMSEGVEYLFYQSYDPSQDERTLLVRTLDSLGNLSEPKVLERMESRRRGRGGFAVVFNRDRSKFGVFTNPPYERKQSENFYVRMYGRDLEELWNADIELKYRDDQYAIMDFEVSNDGSVYVLSYYDAHPNQIAFNARDRIYNLIQINGMSGTTEVVDFELELNNVAVHNIGMECDLLDGTMAISGFYGEKNFLDMDGAIYLSFDQVAGEVVTTSLTPFSSDFVAQFNRIRAKQGKGIRRDFVFRNFMARPDGGAYVVAEDYEVVVRTVQTGRGTTTTNYYYYYRDIVVLSIDPNGEIAWYAHIPKRQSSMNDGGYYLGYILLQNEEGLHFVYNDHKKNIKRWGKKQLRPYTNSRNGVLAMVTLTHEAQMQYHVLDGSSRQRFKVAPRSSRTANQGEDGAILLSLRGARIKFGNLFFEE